MKMKINSPRKWQLWQLASKGSGYCALATASLASLPPQKQDMAQNIAARLLPRDRYSDVKAALLVLVALELGDKVRDEGRPRAAGTAVGRALHYVYAPWSLQFAYRQLNHTGPLP
ncbi:hypothetical protein [Cupriavidus basilensis]|uniref:hypothetical protein n=1 Tax=Cupriavidus basilensis TaxID=68895 RepID=UPI00157B5BD7|nr:hypothetical protein [Cupriavidus basilensis]NUA32230.1 hypothetical protein [Cupriavidus basilensis]